MLAENQKQTFECPYCHKKILIQVGVNVDRPPRPGDVSVCGKCAEIIIFTGGQSVTDYLLADEDETIKLNVRKTTPEELVRILNQNPILNEIQKKIISHDSGRWRR